MKLPMRYLPKMLSNKNRSKQVKIIKLTRKLYQKGIYYKRPLLKSFKSIPSNHVKKAKTMYNVIKIGPTKELEKKTGCSIKGMKDIIKKGEGAYYSSGSRPNQTAHSWAIARLASSITGGKSAMIDYNIIEKECNHSKKAYKLAQKARNKRRSTRHVTI